MPVFIQLSKIQKKFFAHHTAMCRRMNAHDEAHKTAAQRAEEAQREVRKLAVEQAIDDLRAGNADLGLVRLNNALRAQAEQLARGVKVRRNAKETHARGE